MDSATVWWCSKCGRGFISDVAMAAHAADRNSKCRRRIEAEQQRAESANQVQQLQRRLADAEAEAAQLLGELTQSQAELARVKKELTQSQAELARVKKELAGERARRTARSEAE